MASSFFPNDHYTTPPGREKVLHKLLFRPRIYYITKFLSVVLRFWPAARAGRLDQETWSRCSFQVFKALEDCGGRFHIAGLANMQLTESPVVFISNHMSTMETVVLPAIILPYKKAIFVVKEQLFNIPFFGVFPKNAGCIGVARKSPSEDFKQVMTRGSEMISRGYSIIVFPQATRHVTFDPSKFNTLGIKLARRNKIPVIPIALKTNFWTNGKVLNDFGPLDQAQPIHFEFGPPIIIKGQGKQEHEQVTDFIKSRLALWNKSGPTNSG